MVVHETKKGKLWASVFIVASEGKTGEAGQTSLKWGTLMISAGSGVQELTLDVYCLALGHLEWPTV